MKNDLKFSHDMIRYIMTTPIIYEEFIVFLKKIFENNEDHLTTYALSNYHILKDIEIHNREILFIIKKCDDGFKFSAPEVLYYCINVIGFCKYLEINGYPPETYLENLYKYDLLEYF